MPHMALFYFCLYFECEWPAAFCRIIWLTKGYHWQWRRKPDKGDLYVYYSEETRHCSIDSQSPIYFSFEFERAFGIVLMQKKKYWYFWIPFPGQYSKFNQSLHKNVQKSLVQSRYSMCYDLSCVSSWNSGKAMKDLSGFD